MGFWNLDGFGFTQNPVALASQGLSEPLGALAALLFIRPLLSEGFLNYMIGFVGGVMASACVRMTRECGGADWGEGEERVGGGHLTAEWEVRGEEAGKKMEGSVRVFQERRQRVLEKRFERGLG